MCFYFVDPATMPFLSAFHFDLLSSDTDIWPHGYRVPGYCTPWPCVDQVWGFATSCDTEARLEDKLASSRYVVIWGGGGGTQTGEGGIKSKEGGTYMYADYTLRSLYDPGHSDDVIT